MNMNSFASVAATESNPNWKELVERKGSLYESKNEVRSPFARDYTRILHSMAYRRLKHKTQVFFNIDNDHICTRMEHVSHVESVSYSIAKNLGLNTELTKAIAIGHDLGHAPFGHHGESVIRKLSNKYLKTDFWHERNGLRFVDDIELLEDHYKNSLNLNLTYAVRDGIISHCGEIEDNCIKPRNEFIELNEFTKPGQFQPVTWEGCVVKISDKIAYIGRDIEDAISLKFLDDIRIESLRDMARVNDAHAINTTVIMHNLINDICDNSTPDTGITLSTKFLNQLNEILSFNKQYIYLNKRFEPYKKYAEMVITQLFKTLLDAFDKRLVWENLDSLGEYYPVLIESFEKWLARYCDVESIPSPKEALRKKAMVCKNHKIYGNLSDKKTYIQAIIDYLSGMTDRFAIQLFNELLSYKY